MKTFPEINAINTVSECREALVIGYMNLDSIKEEFQQDLRDRLAAIEDRMRRLMATEPDYQSPNRSRSSLTESRPVRTLLTEERYLIASALRIAAEKYAENAKSADLVGHPAIAAVFRSQQADALKLAAVFADADTVEVAG